MDKLNECKDDDVMMMSEALRGKVEESEYCFYRNLPETPSLSPTNLST